MEAAIVANTYLEHLEHSGAVPVALVPSEQTIASADALIKRVDGLLLLGGADVSPEFYGQRARPELEATVPLRDRSEIALARSALAAGVPVLGICRGLHVLNVATGGTLTQDIGELGPTRHRAAPGRLDEATHHEISVTPGSEVACSIGAGLATVNSHHHQAVDRVGDGATVTALSRDDGLVEALEWAGGAFAVGVQWHPEAREFGGVIARFVEAARSEAASSDYRTSGGSDPASERGESHAEAAG